MASQKMTKSKVGDVIHVNNVNQRLTKDDRGIPSSDFRLLINNYYSDNNLKETGLINVIVITW